MKASYLAPLLFLAGFATGCSDAEPPASAPVAATSGVSEALIGTWETITYEVDYTSYLGGDTAYVEHIEEADWGRKYGVKPPSTIFTSDGKLRRTHQLRTGEVANVVNGIWRERGDSLLVIEPNITYTYLYDLQGDRLELSGVVDQDQDGQRDDRFRAVYRLVSRTR